MRFGLLMFYNFVVMLGFTPILIPIYLFRAIGIHSISDKLLIFALNTWGRGLLMTGGIKYKIYGKENLPKFGDVCFVSNHQSYFDAPLLVSHLNQVVGVIAKKQLLKIPLLNLWMIAVRCPFIDRSNREQALQIIKSRVEEIKTGRPMLIFPEGTRSRKQEMNPFKTGGIEVLFQAKVKLIPMTVSNTHKLFEGNHYRVGKDEISLTIHPVFDIAQYEGSFPEFVKELEQILDPLKLTKK